MIKKLFKIVIAFLLFSIIILLIVMALLHHNKIESLSLLGFILLLGLAMSTAWYFAEVVTTFVFSE